MNIIPGDFLIIFQAKEADDDEHLPDVASQEYEVIRHQTSYTIRVEERNQEQCKQALRKLRTSA